MTHSAINLHLSSHHSSNVSLHYHVKYCCQLLNANISQVVWLHIWGAVGSWTIAVFEHTAECDRERVPKIGQKLMKLWNMRGLVFKGRPEYRGGNSCWSIAEVS